MQEIFDPRHPHVTLARTRTVRGARLRIWLMRRSGSFPGVWLDYAREGEGW